jgi:hypothetical protein
MNVTLQGRSSTAAIDFMASKDAASVPFEFAAPRAITTEPMPGRSLTSAPNGATSQSGSSAGCTSYIP